MMHLPAYGGRPA